MVFAQLSSLLNYVLTCAHNMWRLLRNCDGVDPWRVDMLDKFRTATVSTMVCISATLLKKLIQIFFE